MAVWPVAARAQQGERMRRIGVLMGWEADREAQAYLAGFAQGLAELGWTDGRNIRLEVRWEGSSLDRKRGLAKELVELQPDVIVTGNTPETAALQQETRTIPIVFATASDPVGSGFVASLPRPGGNLTGFMFQEASMAGKLLELLTEIAPGVKRAMLMFNPETAPYVESYYLTVFDAAARLLKTVSIVARVHDDHEIEAAITSLGSEPAGGLVTAPDTTPQVYRAKLLSLTERYAIPAVGVPPILVRDGGLISYGPNIVDQFHRAAAYVDRILRGAHPSDLPVQLPVKFHMAVNMKTAKALGLTVPITLLGRADEVIE
jgi:putative ABC transport system substrate-binding protein